MSPLNFKNVLGGLEGVTDTVFPDAQQGFRSREPPPESDLSPWLLTIPPNIQRHDPEIINYFLNKFMDCVPSTLPTFEDFDPSTDVLPDLILAVAAVGGLFCDLEGAFRISLALYNDARRLAQGRVSPRMLSKE